MFIGTQGVYRSESAVVSDSFVIYCQRNSLFVRRRELSHSPISFSSVLVFYFFLAFIFSPIVVCAETETTPHLGVQGGKLAALSSEIQSSILSTQSSPYVLRSGFQRNSRSARNSTKSNSPRPFRQVSFVDRDYTCGVCEVLTRFYQTEIEKVNAADNTRLSSSIRLVRSKYNVLNTSEEFITATMLEEKFQPSWQEYDVLDTPPPYHIIRKSVPGLLKDPETKRLSTFKSRLPQGESPSVIADEALSQKLVNIHKHIISKDKAAIVALWKERELDSMCYKLDYCVMESSTSTLKSTSEKPKVSLSPRRKMTNATVHEEVGKTVNLQQKQHHNASQEEAKVSLHEILTLEKLEKLSSIAHPPTDLRVNAEVEKTIATTTSILLQEATSLRRDEL